MLELFQKMINHHGYGATDMNTSATAEGSPGARVPSSLDLTTLKPILCYQIVKNLSIKVI
jgi:hypothetical protein